jgi:hypothetical protein
MSDYTPVKEVRLAAPLKVIFERRRVRGRRGRPVWRWYVRLVRSGRVLMHSEHYGRLRDAARMVEHVQEAARQDRVRFEYRPRNHREVRRWIGELARRPRRSEEADG